MIAFRCCAGKWKRDEKSSSHGVFDCFILSNKNMVTHNEHLDNFWLLRTFISSFQGSPQIQWYFSSLHLGSMALFITIFSTPCFHQNQWRLCETTEFGSEFWGPNSRLACARSFCSCATCKLPSDPGFFHGTSQVTWRTLNADPKLTPKSWSSRFSCVFVGPGSTCLTDRQNMAEHGRTMALGDLIKKWAAAGVQTSSFSIQKLYGPTHVASVTASYTKYPKWSIYNLNHDHQQTWDLLNWCWLCSFNIMKHQEISLQKILITYIYNITSNMLPNEKHPNNDSRVNDVTTTSELPRAKALRPNRQNSREPNFSPDVTNWGVFSANT